MGTRWKDPLLATGSPNESMVTVGVFDDHEARLEALEFIQHPVGDFGASMDFFIDVRLGAGLVLRGLGGVRARISMDLFLGPGCQNSRQSHLQVTQSHCNLLNWEERQRKLTAPGPFGTACSTNEVCLL